MGDIRVGTAGWSKEYILACAQRAAPRRVCVEFRNRTWMTDDNQRETLEFLAAGGGGRGYCGTSTSTDRGGDGRRTGPGSGIRQAGGRAAPGR